MEIANKNGLEEINFDEAAPKKSSLVTALIVALIALGSATVKYLVDQKEYLAVVASANSIPQFEKVYNFREAEEIEGASWSYLARTNREGAWISRNQYNSLAKMLNENSTIGTPRGQPSK